jgi:hypothetical protein
MVYHPRAHGSPQCRELGNANIVESANRRKLPEGNLAGEKNEHAPIIIILLLLFGGGGGYYAYGNYGGSGLGGVLGTVLVILLILWLLGVLR